MKILADPIRECGVTNEDAIDSTENIEMSPTMETTTDQVHVIDNEIAKEAVEAVTTVTTTTEILYRTLTLALIMEVILGASALTTQEVTITAQWIQPLEDVHKLLITTTETIPIGKELDIMDQHIPTSNIRVTMKPLQQQFLQLHMVVTPVNPARVMQV